RTCVHSSTESSTTSLGQSRAHRVARTRRSSPSPVLHRRGLARQRAFHGGCLRSKRCGDHLFRARVPGVRAWGPLRGDGVGGHRPTHRFPFGVRPVGDGDLRLRRTSCPFAGSTCPAQIVPTAPHSSALWHPTVPAPLCVPSVERLPPPARTRVSPCHRCLPLLVTVCTPG